LLGIAGRESEKSWACETPISGSGDIEAETLLIEALSFDGLQLLAKLKVAGREPLAVPGPGAVPWKRGDTAFNFAVVFIDIDISRRHVRKKVSGYLSAPFIRVARKRGWGKGETEALFFVWCQKKPGPTMKASYCLTAEAERSSHLHEHSYIDAHRRRRGMEPLPETGMQGNGNRRRILRKTQNENRPSGSL
jgi:hypothetical protein